MLNSSSPNRDREKRSTPVPPNLREHGLWVFESRHGQTFEMPVTRHPFFKLLLIREGSGDVEFEGERVPCEKGSLVLVPVSVSHRVIDLPRAPISLIGLGMDFRHLVPVASVINTLPPGVYGESELRAIRIEQRMRKLLYLNEQTDAASLLSSIATAIDLVAELSLLLRPPPTFASVPSSVNTDGSPSPDDPLMETYLAWLHRNFFQPLSLEDAATATGMSRRTFTNRFKSKTGMTWLNYVNLLRIRHAETLLKATDRKVTSIAFQCGFEDLTTFYRAFKRINGKSPGERRTS